MEGDKERAGSENEQSSESSTGASAAGKTGYLVAVGDDKFACRSGETDYTNFSAAEGAGEGDACTVTGENES